MCKFPYSILIVYYSNLILYPVILLYITGILQMMYNYYVQNLHMNHPKINS